MRILEWRKRAREDMNPTKYNKEKIINKKEKEKTNYRVQ
jgi:hypothetical protein